MLVEQVGHRHHHRDVFQHAEAAGQIEIVIRRDRAEGTEVRARVFWQCIKRFLHDTVDVAPQHRYIECVKAQGGTQRRLPLRLDRAGERAVHRVVADAFTGQTTTSCENVRVERRRQGVVEVAGETQFREAEIVRIDQVHVNTIGLDKAEVRRGEEQTAGVRRIAVQTAGCRVATDDGASRVGGAGRRDVAEAGCDGVTRQRARHSVLHGDVVIVDRQGEARCKGRLQYRTQRPGVGGFGPQVDVTARRLVSLSSGRVQNAADRGARCALCNADRAQVGVGQRSGTGAGVDTKIGQARAHRREEFTDVRGANGARVVAANLDALGHFPGAADLPGEGVIRRVRRCIDLVARIACAAFEGQVVEEWLVLHQRDDQLAIDFLDVVTTVNVRRGATGTTEFTRRLGQKVRTLRSLIFAIFGTDSETDRIGGRRNGDTEVTRNDTAQLGERCLVEGGALDLQVIGTGLADRAARAEPIDRDCAGRLDDRVGARAVDQQRVAGAGCRHIVLQRLAIFRFTVGTRQIPIDRIGDLALHAGTIIEDRGREVADTRTDFGRAARQVRGDGAIVRIGGTGCRCSGSANFRRVAGDIGAGGTDVGGAELRTQAGRQERVVQVDDNRGAEQARRCDDGLDVVLGEHAAGVDLQRVRDVILCRTIDIEALERRLEDVVRVEVERRIQRAGEAGRRIILQVAVGRGRVGVRHAVGDRANAREARRNGRSRTRRAAGEAGQTGDREIAGALIDRIGLLIAHRQDCVTAAFVEVATDGQIGTDRLAIALFGEAGRQLQVNAREILFGDEVDDARDGIGTVGGHGGAGQRVDALDEGQRNVVQIDAATNARRGNAVAIKQDDVAARTDAAKIDERSAAVAVVDSRTDARDDARDVAQHFFGDVRRTQLNGFSGGDVDRSGRNQVRVLDQRTGDDDRAFVFGSGRGSSGASGGLGKAGNRRSQQGQDEGRSAALQGGAVERGLRVDHRFGSFIKNGSAMHGVIEPASWDAVQPIQISLPFGNAPLQPLRP